MSQSPGAPFAWLFLLALLLSPALPCRAGELPHSAGTPVVWEGESAHLLGNHADESAPDIARSVLTDDALLPSTDFQLAMPRDAIDSAVSPVPEPNIWTLLCVGAFVLVLRRGDASQRGDKLG